MTEVHRVRDIMSSDPITVTADTTLDEALSLMVDNAVRRLPIVDGDGTLVGIVSDRDLRLAADSPFLRETPDEVIGNLAHHTVEEIMRTVLHTIEQDEPIVEAAKLMRVARVGGLPVVDAQDRLVGVVTRTDLVDHLIRILEPAAETEEDR